MTTSSSLDTPSASSSNGESFSSLPRWRQFLSTLNWRRDPGYEQRERQHEQRMQQLASEIEQIKTDSERIEKETELIKRETEQIKRETEQLRRENARLRMLNARTRHLVSCVDQHCFPDESSSIPATPTEPDCRPSSP